MAMKKGEKFFDESKEQSEVKTAIVSKYFKTWTNVVKGAAKARGEKSLTSICLPVRADSKTGQPPHRCWRWSWLSRIRIYVRCL